ncbi:hypothetical protein ES703_20766 [subsurface metagenome]
MFWNKKGRQDVCILAETNTVSDERLRAGTIHAENPGTAEAWGLDSRLQCQDEKTGRYVQFISSLNCDPIPIYKNPSTPPVKTNTSLIASQTEDQEMVYVDTATNKNSTLLWIGICTALLTLTVCIIALVVFLR